MNARGNGKSTEARLALEEAVRSGKHTHWGDHSGEYEVTEQPIGLLFAPVLSNLSFKAIVCNYLSGGSYVRKGAKAYVNVLYLGGNLPDRLKVEVKSRGGRWIEKWENSARLGNFRLTTISVDHPKFGERRKFQADAEGLERLLRALGGNR